MYLIIWRLILFVVNVLCIFVLLYRLKRYHKTWAPATRDYWWTLLLWSTAGAVIAWQGLVEDLPFSARLLFVTIASLATPIGLRRKKAEHDNDQILQ